MGLAIIDGKAFHHVIRLFQHLSYKPFDASASKPGILSKSALVPFLVNYIVHSQK